MVPATWGQWDHQPRWDGTGGFPAIKPHTRWSRSPHLWDTDPPGEQPHVNPPMLELDPSFRTALPRPFLATKAPFCGVTSASHARRGMAAPGAWPQKARLSWQHRTPGSLQPDASLPSALIKPQVENQCDPGGCGGGRMGGDPAPRPYQRVDAGQGVVGVVQGVEQLINPVVGLAVPVEADTDSRAAGGEGTPN